MIVLTIGIILCLTVLFQRKFATDEKVVFYSYTAIKYLSAVLIGLLYQNYYEISGDTFTVFYQAKDWYEAFISNHITLLQWMGITPVDNAAFSQILPIEHRTRFFAHFVSFLMAVSFNNYYVVAIWMTFFQVMAMWALVRNLIQKQLVYKWVAYIGLLFIPSIAFWSSGLLKETFMLTLMAIVITAYLYFKDSKRVPKWMFVSVILIASFLLFQLKYYVLILLLPLGFITHLFSEWGVFQARSMKVKLVLYFALLTCGLTLVAIIHPVFYSGLFFDLIKISHDQIAQHSADALIYFTSEKDTFLFTVFNAPIALFSAFFRPFVWEAVNPLMMSVALENSVFMALFFFSIYALLKLKLSEKQYWWLLGTLLYVLAMGLIVTLSTPNFGSLARYRVAYMPFCWFTCLWLINKYFTVSKL